MKLHNEVSLENTELYEQHKELIQTMSYDDAAALLSSNSSLDGCTASLLNGWEQKIIELETDSEDKTFTDPYYTSSTEPSASSMSGKVIWQQEY